MKRHPHLQPLSDDHHAALVLARRVRRAAQDGAALEAAWRDARQRFDRELEPHFRVEEERLLPQLEDAGEAALARRTRGDHARLRELVRGAPAPDLAAEFGELLHRHVRFEERELFPRAEEVLPTPVLLAAGRAARAARAL